MTDMSMADFREIFTRGLTPGGITAEELDEALDAYVLDVKTHLVTIVSDGLKSCCGCSWEDGPLQECYAHGEDAARFYIDHAVDAMYHFAGIEKPIATPSDHVTESDRG